MPASISTFGMGTTSGRTTMDWSLSFELRARALSQLAHPDLLDEYLPAEGLIRFCEQRRGPHARKPSTMLPNTSRQWVGPVLALVLCLTAAVLVWYGFGAFFDHDPSATGSVVEH
jgi:hypothetical protein